MVLADGHPQLAGQVLGVDVVAGLDAAGDLPVNKMRCTVHLGQQVGQQSAKLVFRHRDVDIQCLGAGVKAVKVVLQQVDLAVCADSGVVYTVTEEMHTIIEGNCQFLRCADFSVIIGQCFHKSFLPLLLFTVGTLPQISVQ